MDLKDIAAVSGKSGLFKVIKPTRTGVILESLDEAKNCPGGFRRELHRLRNDIISYCSWVEQWPNFVSMIRAKGRGQVKCDIEWLKS